MMNKWLRCWTLLLCAAMAACCDKTGRNEPDGSGPEGPSGPLTIAFITDTHYGQSATASKDMERLINDINSLGGVDFILMGGDLTNIGSDSQIAGAKALLDKLKKPCWTVSGNHDSKWSESGGSTFVKTITYDHFDFEAGGYRFLGCASGPMQRMSPALVSREHLKWLKSLKKGKPVIFLIHYPLDSGMSNWFDVRKELLRLDCRMVIGGHVHSNNAYDYDGLPGFTGRTALRGGTLPAYSIVNIEEDQITVTERRLGDDGTAEMLEPWYTKTLHEVVDAVAYDADGLPENYPWMKYSDNSGYPQVSVRWSRDAGANIASGFAVDGSTGWYTTASGKVCALSLSDGSEKWSRQYEGRILATPSVENGAVAFTCSNGSVYVLDAATGADQWEYPGSSRVASPVIRDGTVYAGSGDGAFRAFSLADGKLLWKCTGIDGFCDAAPFVGDGQVVTGSWGGTLYSIATATGKLQWKWDHSSSFMYSPGACTPLKSGNSLFVACPDRITYCVDAKTGTTLYTVDGGRESLALSADGNTAFVKEMERRTILAFNVTDGNILWEVESGLGKDVGSSALSAVEDWVLIPSDKGFILALDAATGAIVWRHKVGLGLVNPLPAWTENGKICILASSMDGRMELLEITK